MRLVRFDAPRHKGSSLLEVLIALSLLATSILGMAAAQLATLRNAHEHARREHASWIAASVAEAMPLTEASMNILARERARAAAVIPGADLAVVHEAPGVDAVVLEWAQGYGASRSEQALGLGACSTADDDARARCIVLPFASR